MMESTPGSPVQRDLCREVLTDVVSWGADMGTFVTSVPQPVCAQQDCWVSCI